MKIGSTRTLEALEPVLEHPEFSNPNPEYWVFVDATPDKWANLTVITTGNNGGEYPKTYGHYHPVDAPVETYHLIDGEGVLLMQKKHMENGEWTPNQVDAVYLIKAKPGDEIAITPPYGHSWSNLGKTPLLSYDDWRAGHTPADYAEVEELHGMAYYLVEENGQPKAVPNPNYANLPEPQWVTPTEFRAMIDSNAHS